MTPILGVIGSIIGQARHNCASPTHTRPLGPITGLRDPKIRRGGSRAGLWGPEGRLWVRGDDYGSGAHNYVGEPDYRTDLLLTDPPQSGKRKKNGKKSPPDYGFPPSRLWFPPRLWLPPPFFWGGSHPRRGGKALTEYLVAPKQSRRQAGQGTVTPITA